MFLYFTSHAEDPAFCKTHEYEVIHVIFDADTNMLKFLTVDFLEMQTDLTYLSNIQIVEDSDNYIPELDDYIPELPEEIEE